MLIVVRFLQIVIKGLAMMGKVDKNETSSPYPLQRGRAYAKTYNL
jgi:hypothetical protein